MTINEIQKGIDYLFNQYKIPVITHNIPMENLHRWSSEVADHFKLNKEDFRKVVAEFFWSAAHIQLSLGYALIAKKECKFPMGINGKVHKEADMPHAIGLPEIHFWYHLYHCYECIYRSWERMASVLKNVCYPKNKEKMYFDKIVKALETDSLYNKNPHLNSLKKQIKHWNKIAKERNEVSHDKSSPFQNMNIEGKISNILTIDGFPEVYLNYSVASPKENLENVIDKYKKVYPAMKVIVDFIDNIGR